MEPLEPGTSFMADFEQDILEVLDKTKKDAIKPKKNKAQVAKGLPIARYFTTEGENPLDLIKYTKRSTKIINTDGSVIFEMIDAEVPETWSQVASDIIVSKYFRKAGVPQKDDSGKPILDKAGKPVLGGENSVKEVITRMAQCWRIWGEQYGYFKSVADAQAFEDEIKYMMVEQICVPNSPQWFNTGLYSSYGINGPAQGHSYVDPHTGKLEYSKDSYSRPQPHACFIQSVSDSLVEPGGIMDLVLREARVFKYGSGSGTNFSALRGEGEPLSGGGKSSGLMSWLKIFDRSAGAIKSGGTTRRAAKMVCIDIDHPDIEQFIVWKKNEEIKAQVLMDNGYSGGIDGEAYGTVSGQNANNSVRVTKEFFDAVEEEKTWDLRWRTNPKIIAKTLKANELWQTISDAAWHCADPGLQYDTTINEWHTCPKSGRINASNPCSEYMFLDDTACNLASINLVKFYDENAGQFNTDAFRHTVRIWTLALEISVLMAQFPSESMAQNSYDFRTLGLGYANLGTLLMMAGLPYDSNDGRAMAAAVTAIMTGEAYSQSAIMAQHLGAFPKYEMNRDDMLRVIRNHRRAAYNAAPREFEQLSVIPPGLNPDNTPQYLIDAARNSWDRALNLGDKYGYRNAQTTLLAPTGTIGLVMDCDTTGVEPDFALVKMKKLAGGGYWKIINQSVPKALSKLGYKEDEINDILRYAIGSGSLNGSPHINHQSLVEHGFTSTDIEKIELQLPTAFDIRYAFNQFTLGEEAMKRLGFSEERYSDNEFDMLLALGYTESQIDEANEFICGAMTLEGAPRIKTEDLAVFDCANRCGAKGQRFIHHMGHIKMMAAVQPFLSGAISKTINLPAEATVDDVKDAYWQGWVLGLKANALYRDGSKAAQPLTTKSKKEETSPIEIETVPLQVAYTPSRKRPPKERQSITRKVTLSGQKLYLTVGLYPDGTPAELFVNMAQEGSFASGMADAFAKITSIGLQYGVPVDTIISQLEHMRFDPHGFTGDSDIPFATSVADFIAQWLRKTFSENGGPAKMKLPIMDKEDITDQNDTQNPLPAVDNNTQPLFETANDDHAPLVASSSGYSGPPCPECGAMMTPNGRCHKCPNCGATTGCS